MNYSAAIFDLDGTLIDSNPVWEKLDRIILERRNITADDAFFKKLTAMTYEDAAAEIQKLGVNISADDFKTEINELAVYEYSNNIRLKYGAENYLIHLKNSNIKITLATASPAELYVPVLKNNGVYHLFAAFTTTDEVGRSKDYPDIYIEAARKVGVSPECCMAFEDVLKGVLSAKKAGMFTVGVYDESSADYIEEIKKASDKFIYSFNEML